MDFFCCVWFGLWFGCLLLVVDLLVCVCLVDDVVSCGWFANCLVGWLLFSLLAVFCVCVIGVLAALVCG